MPSCNTYRLTWVFTLGVGISSWLLQPRAAIAPCHRAGGYDGRAIAAIARQRGATPRPRSGAEAGRTPCPKGGGQEELPHVRGQGQWPRVPGCDGRRNGGEELPTSEIRGGGREELPCVRGQGQRPRGDTSRMRPGVVAGRSYPMPEARRGGREDQPHTRSQG